MNYRRVYQPGGTFFFTLVTFNRNNYFSSQSNVEILGDAFRYVIKKHPFNMIAHVILPDHLHVIWQLPEGDQDYSTRWRLIKSFVSRNWNNQKCASDITQLIYTHRFWQNRFWEHTIRNQLDLDKHIDYIHFNPVKHKLVEDPLKWKYSSFGKFLDEGTYTDDWGKVEPADIFMGVAGE
jgi:putative transposase